eukprot:GCRY01001693.1.p1 GENE.GCRY01001693.1~~GCRY01001693.1.p1  ORF type:complete len:633 (+),score=110.00 GCRY01001693.1:370-2268(+)
MRCFPLTLLMCILYFSLFNSSHAVQLSPKGIFVENLFVDGISVSDFLSKLGTGVPNPVFELSVIKQDSLNYILQWKANSTCTFFEIEITNVDSAATIVVKTTAPSYVVSHLIGNYSFKVSACLLHCSEPIALLHTFSTEYYSLDFTGSYALRTQSTSEINFGQEFTIEMLLFPRDTPAYYDPAAFSYATPRSFNSFVVFFSGSTGALTVYVAEESFRSGIVLPFNQWTHLMIMVSNSASAGTTTVTIFVNGIQVSSVSKDYKDEIDSGGCVSIGNDQDSFRGGFQDNNQFRGIIDEVRIWSSNFSNSQAFQMFNHRADARFLDTGYLGATKIDASALVAQWSFTGNTIEDMGKDEPKGLYPLERAFSETGSSMATLGSATEGWLAANRVIRFSTTKDALRSKDTVPIPTRGLTLSFWLKVDTLPSGSIAVASFATEFSDNTLTFWILPGSVVIYRMSTLKLTTVTAVESGVWTHWAFTEEFLPDETAVLRLYRNGQLINSLPTTRFFPPRDNYVVFGQDFDCVPPNNLDHGCWQEKQSLGSVGAALDNVHIYSRPLTAEEMAQEPSRCTFYSSPSADPDLAVSFSFDQTSVQPTDPYVFDESGAGTNLLVMSTDMFALESGVPTGACRTQPL